MKKTKYIVKYTNKFKKDFKLAIKRGLDISLLEDIIVNATFYLTGCLFTELKIMYLY